MLNRRDFLTHSALISLAPLAPAFLSQTLAAAPAQQDENILVVIQLDGGNDGLNTIIPFADENYAKFRRELRIPQAEILKLDGEVGMHPAMKPAVELFESGRLTIVQGVGYPNPDRSHFRSMKIWQTANPAVEESAGNYGWLGRAVDAGKISPSAPPDEIFVGGQSVPQALWGRRAVAVSFNHHSDLELAAGVTPAHVPDNNSLDDLSAYLERTVESSFQTARRFAESSRSQKDSSNARYPDNDLARRLQLISRMVQSGAGARVYYVSQSGYDTHAGQLGTHERLLRAFSSAMKAFLDDLAAAKLEERVVVLAFSEFGRRVDENASAGTDHGAAGPVFLAGARTSGGLVGRHPSLTDLDDNDLKMGIDFRAIYAELLDHWLRIPSGTILDGTFGELNVLKHMA